MALKITVPGAVEQRRNELDRIDQSTGGVFEATMFIDTSGIGETIQNVLFPCRFVEEPTFTRGWVMYPNQRLLADSYPMADAGVYVWNYGFRPDTGAKFYDGATLCFKVLSGPDELDLRWSLVFRAKAIRTLPQS